MKFSKRTIITIFLFFLAFLCGKFFGDSQQQIEHKEDPPRVFIEQLKTKMNITKNRDDIEIYLNGSKMTEDVKLEIP